jgi:hypothetical protein
MKGESFKNGLTEQVPVGQKHPRGETKVGQRPKCKKEKVSSDRGKFKMQ